MGRVQRIHKTNRESIHGSIHEPNHEDRHESNHERIHHTNHERIHETIHETIHQQHTKGFTTGFTKGFTNKLLYYLKWPAGWQKKHAKSFGAESLLYRRSPTVLVQNLCCIGVAQLLYYLKWPPGKKELIINSTFITRIYVVSTGSNFITRISVVSWEPHSRDAAWRGGWEDELGSLALIRRIPRADLRSHARTQRKHKHETRFPGWGILDGFTPPTSDIYIYIYIYMHSGVSAWGGWQQVLQHLLATVLPCLSSYLSVCLCPFVCLCV